MRKSCKHRAEPGRRKRRIVSRSWSAHFEQLTVVLVHIRDGRPHNLEFHVHDLYSTSKMSSTSTGVPSGRLATPYTKRLGFFCFPKTSCSSSEAPPATFGSLRTSPAVAPNTP